MNAARASTFRPSARAGLILAALAAGVLALSSIPASAATVIGSATGTVGLGCSGNMDTVQLTSAGVGYAVPAPGGVITSWSTTALNNLGPAGLLVWRPTTTAGTFTLVAATTPAPLTLGLNTFNLTTPISVQAGDVLGLRSEGRTDCIASAAAGNLMGYHVGPTVGLNQPEALLTDPLLLTLNVSATIGTVAPPTGTPPPTTGGGDEQQTGDHQTDDNGRPATPTSTTHPSPPTKPTKPAKPTKSDGTDKQQSSGDGTKSTGHNSGEKGDLFKPDL
jgi:hypothetical protein